MALVVQAATFPNLSIRRQSQISGGADEKENGAERRNFGPKAPPSIQSFRLAARVSAAAVTVGGLVRSTGN